MLKLRYLLIQGNLLLRRMVLFLWSKNIANPLGIRKMTIDKKLNDKINNGEILLMVFYPILVPIFGFFALSQNLLYLLAFLPHAVWIAVWIRDIRRIKNEGIYVDVWKYTGLLGLFVPPVYFWTRKVKTNTGATLPVLNTVLTILLFLFRFFYR